MRLPAQMATVVVFLARLALGCIFLASGLLKLRQPYDFLIDVYKYQLVGLFLSKVVAMILPWLETILGICLLGDIILGGSFVIAGLLSCVFAVAQLSAVVRVLPISCGCFGGLWADETVNYTSVGRSVAMLIVAMLGLIAWAISYRIQTKIPKAGAVLSA